MDNPFDNDVYAQLEHLKIKLNLKEKEFAATIKSQKEDHEKMLKERDEEITQFVESLIKENYDLKKVIVSLEIEIEKYKDKAYYNEMIKDDENKDFYHNIKIIKESFEKKQKELLEKYDKSSKNFQKEHKQVVSSIRKTAYENKMKIINEDSQMDEEHQIPLRLMEEQLAIYENRGRLLYEDLRNKENYALVIEQKYEMLNEENKFLKLKIQEEKGLILKQIQEYQAENQTIQEELLNKLNSEIKEKKQFLEKSIKDSTTRSQENISHLYREKENLKNEMESLNGKCEKLKKDLANSHREKDELQQRFDNFKKEYINLENSKAKVEREMIDIATERDSYKKTNNNLTDRFGELQSKITSLEITNKCYVDSTAKEVEKNELKNKIIIDNLHSQISDLEKKLREINLHLSEKKTRIDQLMKKIEDLEDLNENQALMIDRLKSETNQKETELKINVNDIGNLSTTKEKLLKRIEDLSEIIQSKDGDIKKLNERIAEEETQINNMKKDYQRLKQVKDDLLNNYEEIKKTNIVLTAQIETTKITSSIELQRLKNQIVEIEKKTVDKSKLEASEILNTELKTELRNLKLDVTKLYKIYLQKSGNYKEDTENTLNQYEETKMLSDMEVGIDRLISNLTKKLDNKKENHKKQIDKHEAEILNLKKRLNTFIQITNSVGGTTTQTSTNSFKTIEKDNTNSLYENILVYLRNINLKHLLELFQLNLQREEEINSVLSDKSYASNLTATKSQIIDLYANFNSLKKIVEQAFIEFQSRAKFYIQPEDFEKTVNESRNFTQNLIDMILDTLMNYKAEVSNFIVFKLPVDDYNMLIENISANLEKFSNKINSQVENYNKVHGNIEKAIEILMKNTVVDYDVVNALMKEKFI